MKMIKKEIKCIDLYKMIRKDLRKSSLWRLLENRNDYGEIQHIINNIKIRIYRETKNIYLYTYDDSVAGKFKDLCFPNNYNMNVIKRRTFRVLKNQIKYADNNKLYNVFINVDESRDEKLNEILS